MICIYREYDPDLTANNYRAVIQADTTPSEFPLTGENVMDMKGEYLGEEVVFAPGSIIHCVDTGKNWVMNQDRTAWGQDGSTNTMPAVYPHITLMVHELNIYLNDSGYMYPQEIYPMDASYSVVWTTSDNEVAYISETGTVEGTDNIQIEGRQAGTATITASFTYEGKTYSDSCVVTVTETE